MTIMQQISLPAEASAQAGWHTKTVSEILDALRSQEHGLTKEEAINRRINHFSRRDTQILLP